MAGAGSAVGAIGANVSCQPGAFASIRLLLFELLTVGLWGKAPWKGEEVNVSEVRARPTPRVGITTYVYCIKAQNYTQFIRPRGRSLRCLGN